MSPIYYFFKRVSDLFISLSLVAMLKTPFLILTLLDRSQGEEEERSNKPIYPITKIIIE